MTSIGEANSAFGASSFQNFSAVGGSHSFAEPVFLASLLFLGLIRSFHGCTSFVVIMTPIYQTRIPINRIKAEYIIPEKNTFVKTFPVFLSKEISAPSALPPAGRRKAKK